MTQILLVDDHPVFRDGLRTLIDRQPGFSVVADADDPIGALRALRAHSVDLAIIDLSLRKGAGLSLVKSIRSERPDFPILVLSMHDEKAWAERAFQAGAQGYVMKHQPWNELLSAIRRVEAGQFAFSGDVMRVLLHTPRNTDPSALSSLSDREVEVFEQLGRGLRMREVADRLGISPKTVESHVASLKRKLDIAHANELIYRATLWAASRAQP